jgi:hypothetical protein
MVQNSGLEGEKYDTEEHPQTRAAHSCHSFGEQLTMTVWEHKLAVAMAKPSKHAV